MSKHQRTTRSTPPPAQRYNRNAIVAYFIMVALMLVASLVPSWRVWGVNWWAYYPFWVPALLTLAGIALGLAVWRWSCTLGTGESSFQPPIWILWSFCLLMAVAFVLLPSATHFTGDGYQLLAQLGHGSSSVKAWDIGADAIHRFFYSFGSGESASRALRAFRIESVTAGVLVMAVLLVVLRQLYDDRLRRLLFLAGVLTGGYMLMFFGYVENYAFLLALEIMFCLLGVLVANERISAWWLLVIVFPALVVHIFAAALIPGLLYLILRKTTAARKLAEAFARRTSLYVILSVVIGLVAYLLIRRSSLFFTFAFFPVFPDRFTVEGDWLFSAKHIADLFNLLLLMSPSLLLLLGLFLAERRQPRRESIEMRFLGVTLLGTLLTVYLFNPGIGMPRNWDLFAIVGPPLVVLTCRYFLRPDRVVRIAVLYSGLATALSLLSLGPRAVAHATPQLGIGHFRDYLTLDVVRNRNARRLLVDYYKSAGDSVQAETERAQAEADYPEVVMGKKAKDLMAKGQYREASGYLRRAITLNPLYYDGYGNLGVCFLQTGQLDSARALLEISDGINPYCSQTVCNLGTLFLRSSNPAEAEKKFVEALRLDSANSQAMAGLAAVCMTAGRFDESLHWLNRLAADTTFPADYFRQAGEAFLQKHASAQASEAFRIALARGLDSSYVRKRASENPELRK